MHHILFAFLFSFINVAMGEQPLPVAERHCDSAEACEHHLELVREQAGRQFRDCLYPAALLHHWNGYLRSYERTLSTLPERLHELERKAAPSEEDRILMWHLGTDISVARRQIPKIKKDRDRYRSALLDHVKAVHDLYLALIKMQHDLGIPAVTLDLTLEAKIEMVTSDTERIDCRALFPH